MVYTLLNATALGYDVVRRPAAPRLVQVLLTGLTAPPVLLWDLAARHPAAVLPRQEQREWLAAAALTRYARAATAHPHQPAGGGDVVSGLRTWGTAGLATFTLGRATCLDQFVRSELLGSGSPGHAVPPHVLRLAADLIAEAAVITWTTGLTGPTGSLGPPEDPSSALEAAVIACALPASIDLGPRADQVTALIAGLPAQVRQWRDRPPTVHQPPTVWSTAMHEATWAVHLSGRERAAAAAQLLTAARLSSAGTSPLDLAGGAWNAASAAVAAAVVGDLLPAEAAEILTGHGWIGDR